MAMSETIQRSPNLLPFMWHALFLALTSNLVDVHTVIPAMLIKAGGDELHLGFMTAIMLGGGTLMQLVFAGLLSHRPRKRPFLLWGINLRVAALASLAVLFGVSARLPGGALILLIFVLITVFSFSGAFANISYVDILGKSLQGAQRKSFLSIKQVVNSVGVLVSALCARELLARLSFPDNYALLFALAASLLWVASLGFWRLQEEPLDGVRKMGLVRFFGQIPTAVRADANLKYYLLLINSLGLGLSVLPFVISFARDHFGLSGELVGNFLLFKTLGMWVAAMALMRLAKRFRYKQLLILSLVLAAAIPPLVLALGDAPRLFPYVLILAGVFVATYKVAISGILLEISTDENRASYTGIAGAGGILTTLFPLVAGVLLQRLGYTLVFLGVSAVVLSSLVLVRRLDCGQRQQSTL